MYIHPLASVLKRASILWDGRNSCTRTNFMRTDMAETPNVTHGWAVVTGASGGMGAVFTRALAKRGYPVLAVARAATPLAKLAEEMRSEGARVETLASDLATTEGVAAVVERARALGDIELLVNNAGLSTSGRFLDQPRDREIQSIRVNVEALYTLIRDLVPDMVKKGCGGVINIASVTAFQAIPFWTTYAATKAFVLSFSEGLAYELRGTGVRVLTVCPGFTKTALYAESGVPGVAGRLLRHAAPERVVDTALAAYDHNRVVRTVGFTNQLLASAGALTPRPILRWLMARMFAPTGG
jgi:short-subunit dehydrogenase